MRISRDYWPRIRGRYSTTEAARMILKTHTMADIRHVALLLGLSLRQMSVERSRLFARRYGI